VGSESEIVFKPLPSDDPLQRRPDITLAQTRLSWKPSTALDDGLRKTIAYFKATIVQTLVGGKGEIPSLGKMSFTPARAAPRGFARKPAAAAADSKPAAGGKSLEASHPKAAA
jgi:hypothetical protein